MNLQRYISTVYSELIPLKYQAQLTDELKKIDTNDKNLRFETIRNKYTVEYESYSSKNSDPDTQKYNKLLIHSLFFEIMFGNTIGALYKKTTHTVFLFPVFFDVDDSSRRLNDAIVDIYTNILKKKKTQEFSREPIVSDPLKSSGNMFLFVPVLSDGEDDIKEFNERLTSYFDRAFTFIDEIRKKKSSDLSERSPAKFEGVVYTLDKENRFFTGYYKKKLTEDKIKSLNGMVEKFVEKLGCRLTSVKDPLAKLTRDDSRKKMISENIPDNKVNKETFYKLVDSFNDVYKKTNDREYLKLASSSENQTKFRIYYRVNNTDLADSFNEIKPGSSYVYKITNQDKCAVGYFKERRGATNQYIFREYTGLTAESCKLDKASSKAKLEEQEDADFKDESQTDITEYVIETKNYGSVIKYKRVMKNDYKPNYPGFVELFTDLHIYEKYKWFQFNEIDGMLTPETNIKIYNNILFDKKSLIEFLNEKKLYTEKSRLAVEFLKINQNNTLLLEYVDYILTHKKKTNVFEETFFSGKLDTFIEKNKKNIIEILFQTNELIYMNPQRTSQTKENIKQNYKIVNYTQYPAFRENDPENHFEKVIYDGKEKKYCKKGVYELTNELVKSHEKDSLEYAIVIIDVTKDNIEVVSDLKAKTQCKKLRKTLRKQLQPFLQLIMPRFGGRSKRLRTRRRKYRH